MSTLKKREISANLVWSKDFPAEIVWTVNVRAAVDDDTADGGEKKIRIGSDSGKLSRSQFRGLTGQQIENTVRAKADELLQNLGSGAGTHTLEDDVGD